MSGVDSAAPRFLVGGRRVDLELGIVVADMGHHSFLYSTSLSIFLDFLVKELCSNIIKNLI